jgi:hypothetical protein
MSIRREEIHLSTKVSRALWLLAKRHGPITDNQGLSRIMTADELADGMLNLQIAEKHPETYRLLEQMDKLEREFLKEPK